MIVKNNERLIFSVAAHLWPAANATEDIANKAFAEKVSGTQPMGVPGLKDEFPLVFSAIEQGAGWSVIQGTSPKIHFQWDANMAIHPLVEVVSARDYYGAISWGTVVLVHGSPTLFKGEDHPQQADDFVSRHLSTVSLRGNHNPPLQTLQYWHRSLSEQVSQWLVSLDSENRILCIGT